MKNYGMSLRLFTVTLLGIALTTSSTLASTLTVVRVAPYQSDAELSQTFTINITISDVQNLYGLEVALYWNSSILEIVGIDVRLGYESYEDGVLHEIPETARVQIYENKTSQEQGRYVLAASSVAPAPSFNGSGNIVRVIFQVKNSGSCNLSVQTKLYDKPLIGQVSKQILHTTQGGVFGRVPEVSIFPYLVIAMVIVTAVIIMWLCRKIQKRRGQESQETRAPLGAGVHD
jgi:hypothetical protein